MFSPKVNSEIVIGGRRYAFAPHPVVPSIPWGQEGRRAIVYRLLAQNGSGHRAYALKVFRQVFRHEGLLDAADALRDFAELPGMDVCDQVVLTPHTHPDVIDQYEDLNYAMMMPWIEGETWFDHLNTREVITLDQSRAIAESMAWVLYALEYNHLAHCDLSSGNVIVGTTGVDVQLIDVEDLYSPQLVPPPFVPLGTMGYQHHAVPSASTGQWSPRGDRFAGAVLIAEMLAWAHPDIREAAHGESYFAPEELHEYTERYDLLVDVLTMFHPGFAEAFEQAWRSRSLEECPPIETWYQLFDILPRDPVAEWADLDPDDFPEPEPQVAQQAPKVSVRKRPATVSPAAPSSSPQPKQSWHQRLGITGGCRAVFVFTLVMMFLSCFGCVMGVQLMNLAP
jgi:serine/threonine protein kinase